MSKEYKDLIKKKNEDESVECLKARLVANDMCQIEGMEYH